MGQDYYEQRYKNRVLANLKRRAKQLGYELSYVKEQQELVQTADLVIFNILRRNRCPVGGVL